MTRRLLPLAVCGLAFLAFNLRADDSVSAIRDIRVQNRGAPVPQLDFVLACTAVRVGDTLDRRRISHDVKTLIKTGRFSFVDTEIERLDNGYRLTYIVELKPRLAQPVDVIGMERYSQRKIRKWLELEPGDPVDEAILAAAKRKVLEEYRKRFFPYTTLDSRIEVEPETGLATVRLEVKEGARASLRKIAFEGNDSVKAKELRDSMKHKTWNLFSFLTKRGAYTPDDLEADRENLRRVYLNRGFLDVVIGEPEVALLKPDGKKLGARFSVTEGRRYVVDRLSITGRKLFEESVLQPLIALKPGDIASMEAIDKSADELRDYYQSRGYLRTSVHPALTTAGRESRWDGPTSLTGSDAVVNVTFQIAEGTLVYFRNVEIQGQLVTKDEVIRRELPVYPGEVYDQVKARRCERIVQNLGLFETVSASPRETDDPSRDDLVINLEEKRTGQIGVGVGYSSIDDILGYAEFSQGNFDLLGWPTFLGDGQKLKLRTQIGTRRQDYELSFVEPWFLDRKLSLGVDLYRHDLSYLSSLFSERQTGGSVTLGKPLPNMIFFKRANLKYTLEEIQIYGVETNASEAIRSEEGSRMQSRLGLTLVHNTRDNVFVPKHGNKTSVGSYFTGGPLGFDTHIYGFEAESASFWSPWFNHVISLRGEAEVVERYDGDTRVPIFDRLFLGGARTLRGFKYRHVGPKDETGEPIGGRSMAMGSAEYSIPVFKVIRLATFYDIGNVWPDAFEFDSNQYASDVGVGLRLDIPGFPIRLDYAWPLEIPDDVNRTNARFNLSFGYGF